MTVTTPTRATAAGGRSARLFPRAPPVSPSLRACGAGSAGLRRATLSAPDTRVSAPADPPADGRRGPTDVRNESMATLIERSSLGTREGQLRRSTVPTSTGKAIARSAIAGRYVTAATPAQRSRITVAGHRTNPTEEARQEPRGRPGPPTHSAAEPVQPDRPAPAADGPPGTPPTRSRARCWPSAEAQVNAVFKVSEPHTVLTACTGLRRTALEPNRSRRRGRRAAGPVVRRVRGPCAVEP